MAVHCGDCSDGIISISGESDKEEAVCVGERGVALAIFFLFDSLTVVSNINKKNYV